MRLRKEEEEESRRWWWWWCMERKEGRSFSNSRAERE
jgi:hypothetical protein